MLMYAYISIDVGTVAKLAMRQPFVLFKGLTFQNSAYQAHFAQGITIIKC